MHNCSEIALGLTQEDFHKDAEFAASGQVRYTTGTESFCRAFRSLATEVAPGVDLTLPLADFRKSDVILEAQRLGVDLSQTYSCMRASASGKHCGTCLQCKSRRTAFQAAGIAEPDGFYER